MRRPSLSVYSSTKLRVVRFEDDSFSSAGISISTLKWPELRDDGAVLHCFEVLLGEHVFVAGDGAENVADFGGFFHGHDAEAVHDGFEGFGRIDFGDDDVGARAARAHGHAAAAPAVAGDDELRAGKQEVGGADDAVDAWTGRCHSDCRTGAWCRRR